jgi:transcriptional regulator with GAF, ATPase, and Fis domain
VETALAAEALLSLAVSVTSQQRVESVLTKIVEGLASQPGIALARVWLLPSVHIPASLQEFAHNPDGAEYLRLVASAGKPKNSPGEDWSFLGGKFARFSLGTGKVGQVAAGRKALLVRDFAPHENWIARPDWVQREGIRCFAGYPLLCRDNLLGVTGIFSRQPLGDQEFAWLGVFANHAAVAIANARAFEEVEKLQRQLQGENEYLQEQVRQSFEFGTIVGRSKALSEVLHNVRLVATTDSTVLIGGESGTGKELVARAIHEGSARHERPLITVNCASIPRELFESEFFGHVKGAFTGALRDRLGRFQLADKGTLFLDEVGEIPFELQSKLLRVLQEGTFERVGEDRVRRVDVRVIAATNRDLFGELDAGRFRRDLYFRLNVFPLRMPALRDRPDDIGLLAEHFAMLASKRLKIPYSGPTADDVELLSKYAWPGNIRELQNVIERAVIISQGGPLRIDMALGSFGNSLKPAGIRASVLSKKEMEQRERENIFNALEQSKGKIYGPDGAAAILGIKPTTLASRMKKLKVPAEKRTGAME